MLNAIIVVLEGAAGVVRGINEDALHLSGEVLLQGLEGEEVVPVDEAVVEEVPVRDTVRRMKRLVRLLQQDARLQPRPVLLADPGEFEFGFFGHAWKGLTTKSTENTKGGMGIVF
jgi:hypothetical protein